MNGYVKSSVCHSVSGFIRYCRTGTKNDREDYITEYSTAPFEFWSELAKENRIRHKENKLNKNKKAVEGRQLMVKIDKDNHITAEQFAKRLKKILGVEVFVFEHWKGNNRHFHVIIADRTKLKEPIPARLSPRTYYYDEKGKKCKKADAVKIVPKGTVLNAEQKFSEKIDEFRTKGWLENLKSELFEFLEMTKFDNENQFAFETIGTQKVKSDDTEYISAAKERNKFRAELNAYFAEEGTPSKREFCERYGLTYSDEEGRECLMKYIPNDQIGEIKEFFAEFAKQYPLPEKMAENRFESLTDQELVETYIDLKGDIEWDFEKYDCSYQHLEKYAVWEQNGKTDWIYKKDFITKDYEFVSDDKKVNALIDKYELPINKINSNETRSAAYEIATKVLELLKELVDYLKELIGIENIKTIEHDLEEHNISDSFY